MADYIVNALLTEQGVSMGDHGQDVTTAIDVRPDDTIGSIVERHMMRPDYRTWGVSDVTPNPHVFIVLRVAADRDDVERPAEAVKAPGPF